MSLRRAKAQSVSKISENNSQSLTRIPAALASASLEMLLLLALALPLLPPPLLFLEVRDFRADSSLSAVAKDSRALDSRPWDPPPPCESESDTCD